MLGLLLLIQTAAEQPLNLDCIGRKAGNWTTPAYHHPVPEGEQPVDVRLFDGTDRIRLPQYMIPAFHGGSNGWFRLRHVVAAGRTIRARAAINFASHLDVLIDRESGAIMIGKDGRDYTGRC